MKPSNHVTNLPCFEQVAWVIGNANAQRELFKVACKRECLTLDFNNESVFWAFDWFLSPQGTSFWSLIDEGVNPYEK